MPVIAFKENFLVIDEVRRGLPISSCFNPVPSRHFALPGKVRTGSNEIPPVLILTSAHFPNAGHRRIGQYSDTVKAYLEVQFRAGVFPGKSRRAVIVNVNQYFAV